MTEIATNKKQKRLLFSVGLFNQFISLKCKYCSLTETHIPHCFWIGLKKKKKSKTLINQCLFTQNARKTVTVVVQQAMNSQDLPAKDAPLTVNEQVTLTCLLKSTREPPTSHCKPMLPSSSLLPFVSMCNILHHNRVIYCHALRTFESPNNTCRSMLVRVTDL